MVDTDLTPDEQTGPLDSHDVVVAMELLRLADQNLPLEEVVAQLLPQLSHALAASDGLALLIAPVLASVARAPEPGAPIEEVASWANTALECASAVTAVRGTAVLPLLTAHDRTEVIQRILAFNCWTVLESGGLTVLFLLRVSASNPTSLEASQAAFRHITAALGTRLGLAQRTQPRLQQRQAIDSVGEQTDVDVGVDHVLATIVAQARELLQTDCAYLSEVDELAGRLRMRATSGIEDEGYKQSTGQLGETLFGAVALSRQVICTDDYLSDSRFVHTPTTDANVAREGLQGIIAAPLQLGGRVLGVLGAANRGPINTSPDRLELFRGLAHGAAIALENARLHAEQRWLVERLQTLNELNSTQHAALQRSVSIQNQLTDLVLQGHSLEVIALRLSNLLANPIIVLGPFFTCLVAAGIEAGEASAIGSVVASARVTPRSMVDWTRMITARKPIRLEQADRGPTAPAMVVTPIVVGHDVVGYVLVIERETSLDDPEFIALQQAATVFAVELTRTRVVAEVEHRLRADFVNDLVSGSYDSNMILSRARGIGHDLNVPQVLLALISRPAPSGSGMSPSVPVAAGSIDDQRRIEQAARTSLRQRGLMAQVSVIGEVTVVLAALTGPARLVEDRAGVLARELYHDLVASLRPATVVIGMSRICWTMEMIAGAYREALIAMKKGQRFDPDSSLTTFNHLGVERVLSMAPDPRDLQEYVESHLGSLINYDRERGSSLVATLEAYLNSGGRLRETARAVGIHVNSLAHRLRRIEEIGAVSLGDADARLGLALALRARRLLRSNDHEA